MTQGDRAKKPWKPRVSLTLYWRQGKEVDWFGQIRDGSRRVLWVAKSNQSTSEGRKILRRVK